MNSTKPPQRRKRGAGSVFYDKARQHWVGQLDLGFDADGRRHRKKISAPDAATCQAMLEDLREGAPEARSWSCLVRKCWSRSVTDQPVLLCRRHLDMLLRQVKRKRTEGQPVVYFARNGSLIKIGWAINARNRIRQLALPQSALVGTMPGTREDEKKLHRQFAASRVGRSEWFASTPELEKLMSDLNGPPDGSFGPAETAAEAS